VVICLRQAEYDLHMVQLMSLPPGHLFVKSEVGLTFLVPAYPGCLAKEAFKWVSVCHKCVKQSLCKASLLLCWTELFV